MDRTLEANQYLFHQTSRGRDFLREAEVGLFTTCISKSLLSAQLHGSQKCHPCSTCGDQYHRTTLKSVGNLCSLKWQRPACLHYKAILVCCLSQSCLDRKLNRGEEEKQSKMDVLVGGSDHFASHSIVQSSFCCTVTSSCGSVIGKCFYFLSIFIFLLSLCASLSQKM